MLNYKRLAPKTTTTTITTVCPKISRNGTTKKKNKEQKIIFINHMLTHSKHTCVTVLDFVWMCVFVCASPAEYIHDCNSNQNNLATFIFCFYFGFALTILSLLLTQLLDCPFFRRILHFHSANVLIIIVILQANGIFVFKNSSIQHLAHVNTECINTHYPI